MSFEQALLQTLLAYNSVEEATREQLQLNLQARDIHYTQQYCTAVLIAPGIYLNRRIKSPFLPEDVTYTARNGHQPLPPEQNGLVELSITYQPPHSLLVRLDFIPRLLFPPGTIDPKSAIVTTDSEQGCLWADRIEGDGYYHLKSKPNDGLNVKVAISQDGIQAISCVSKGIGNGTITQFFKDMRYEGLDALVE